VIQQPPTQKEAISQLWAEVIGTNGEGLCAKVAENNENIVEVKQDVAFIKGQVSNCPIKRNSRMPFWKRVTLDTLKIAVPLAVILFFILLMLRKKKAFEGQVFLWFLILHSTARLCMERFRGDDRGAILSGDMSVTQFVTLLILAGAIVALFVFKKRREKN